MSVVIKVSNLTKIYHLYDTPIDRVKEALHPLRKSYHQDFYALNDVSLSINSGETVGIIGQNGAGKSTLLKIITNVLTQSSGNIEVHGKVSALLELGTGFNMEMSGIENVYFAGSLMGYSKKDMDERLQNILDFADIGDFINHPVKMYSSGMFARLAFAVAINVDPDILIVDEALSVGDMNFQSRCFAKFKEFQEAGKTILFVTHSLDSVIRYCQRAILIDKGRVIAEGDPKEIVDIYKKLLVNLHHPELENSSEGEHNIDSRVKIVDSSLLKANFEINKDCQAYGNGVAEIIDFAILDKELNPAQKLFNGDDFTVYFKVKFNQVAKSPIFAFTIRDIKGLEITGTNTYFEHVNTGEFRVGDVVEIRFKQKMRLQSGGYALSLGCTNFNSDAFDVYARLYDVLLFEVISSKLSVGFFDPGSEITIAEAK